LSLPEKVTKVAERPRRFVLRSRPGQSSSHGLGPRSEADAAAERRAIDRSNSLGARIDAAMSDLTLLEWADEDAFGPARQQALVSRFSDVGTLVVGTRLGVIRRIRDRTSASKSSKRSIPRATRAFSEKLIICFSMPVTRSSR
jgi:hypothetical protein